MAHRWNSAEAAKARRARGGHASVRASREAGREHAGAWMVKIRWDRVRAEKLRVALDASPPTADTWADRPWSTRIGGDAPQLTDAASHEY